MSESQTMPDFTITRVFDAPPEMLWRAWTDPDEAPHWLHPYGVTTPRQRVRYDVRVGGTYEYVMVGDDGTEYPTGGTYLELVEPERLVLTWGRPGDSDAPVITVTLAAVDGGRTEMTFHVRGIDGRPGDDDVYDGWAEALENLGSRLAAVTTS